MLSFMREQEHEDSSVQKSHSGKSVNGGTASDSANKTQEQEYLTVAARDKNLHRSTMLLVVLFGIGLLCLWFMIKKSTPQRAAAELVGTEEAQIQTAITRLIGVRSEMFNRMDEIVRKFYEFSDVQQVKVSELVKNPFELEMFLNSLKQKADIEERDSDIDADMIKRQRLRQQTKNMQLLSIMQSDQRNCCMIDDKILYEGDSIRGFNVRQIGDGFVKLESEDVELVLKLSE